VLDSIFTEGYSGDCGEVGAATAEMALRGTRPPTGTGPGRLAGAGPGPAMGARPDRPRLSRHHRTGGGPPGPPPGSHQPLPCPAHPSSQEIGGVCGFGDEIGTMAPKSFPSGEFSRKCQMVPLPHITSLRTTNGSAAGRPMWLPQ